METTTARPKKDCNLCNKPELTVYIDGATTMGRWGDMCESCHKKYGRGLGIGVGQRYEWNQESGRYIQVAGGSQKGKKF